MGAPDVFDEQLSLKRLTVAYKRSDWRMFEHALMRLAHEIARPSPFRAHAAWQAFWRAAEADPELPAPLKARLGESLSQLLKFDAQPTPTTPDRPLTATSGIALVDLWRFPLREAEVRRAFRAHIAAARVMSAARERLSGWLTGEPDELEVLLSKYNSAQMALAAGLNLVEPAWSEALLGGLHQALFNQAPPVTHLLEDTAGLGPLRVLTLDPGPAWQRHYGPCTFTHEPPTPVEPGPQEPARLYQLAGALDSFYCHVCSHQTRLAPGAPMALALICPGCGGACGPFITPGAAVRHSTYPLSHLWERAREALRKSAVWALLTPPDPSDERACWLLESGLEGKRVIVIDEDDARLHAWQAQLNTRGAGSIVTSHGPADEVLGLLLHGSIPRQVLPESVVPYSGEPSVGAAEIPSSQPRKGPPTGASLKKKGRH